MGRVLSSLCFCLIINTGLCVQPSGPDRPARSGGRAPDAPQAKEGVTGRITNEDGVPLEGAAVLAAALDPGGPAIPELAIVSDADGRYQWPLRSGEYELTVVAEGYRRVSKRVTVRAGEFTTLDFALSRAPGPPA